MLLQKIYEEDDKIDCVLSRMGKSIEEGRKKFLKT